MCQRSVIALLLLASWAHADESPLEVSDALVVTSPDLSGPERKAVAMLVEEVASRSRVQWKSVDAWPSEPPRTAIVVGRSATLKPLTAKAGLEVPAGSGKPEGFTVRVVRDEERTVVWIVGDDVRGVLFGVGKLLRTLRIERDRVTLPGDLNVTTSPRYPLRGHQLGYRPKTNSYDAWTVAMWEQYIRDLIVFGCNAIELVPPRSDDHADSPHFPLPQLAMMKAMSGIADSYGLDVWIWYPALDADYNDPKTVAFALDEWATVFKALPRLDAVLVPGGDPGATPPAPLMALLEKQTANLKRSHPKATMWVSPQSFDRDKMNEFLAIVKREPEWLGGIVFGPQNRLSLPDLRRAIPSKYPIRFYPDITHSRSCQYPVPNWDQAFGVTEAREVINPRPRDEAAILRLLGPYTNGFITYSEGCNDDVNKAVWSALGWDPEADVMGALRDYGRYYIGADVADAFAQGLLALEGNWRGPVLANPGIETTLQQFRDLERTASPRMKANWRFQQALYRAYYDATIRRRAMHETGLEAEALEALRHARRDGSLSALDAAERILDRAVNEPVARDLRARTFELAEALFQSIRMQLSVERYRAIETSRGASQDTIDMPLNSRPWLKTQFEAIRKRDSERERLDRIAALADRTDPGPGGFYDDLGNTARQPHLVMGPGFDADPAALSSCIMHFDESMFGPTAWRDQALALYETPLKMRYPDLDPTARYKLRVVYGSGPIQLKANGAIEVHPDLDRRHEPLEFALPPEATNHGTLELSWSAKAGRGGNGRGCQVAEVWLIRVESAPSKAPRP